MVLLLHASHKVAFITGVSRGIGLALTKNLIAQGIHVVGVSRLDAQRMKEILIHPDFYYISADVTTAVGLQHIRQYIEDNRLSFDVVVHNAGVMMEPQIIEKLSYDDMERVINTNLMAPMKLTHMLIPYCNMHAKMLFITSRAATTAVAQVVPYCVSKAGLNMLVRILQQEIPHEKIAIALAIPGEVDTAMQEILRNTPSFALWTIFASNYQQNKLISPDVCAKFLTWLLCDTSARLFAQDEPWDIYDSKYHVNWLSGHLPESPFT